MDRPTVTQTTSDGIRMQAKPLRPLGNCQLEAIMFQESTVAAVGVLLVLCRPTAVLWRIGAIVVNAVKRCVLGAFAHICKEVGEAPFPAIADDNASTTVARIAIGIRVVATLFHLSVRRAHRVIAQAVFVLCQCSKFALQTATALTLSMYKVIGTYRILVTTIAPTEPIRITVFRAMRKLNHSPSAKSLTSQIFHGSLLQKAYHELDNSASSNGGLATAMAAL